MRKLLSLLTLLFFGIAAQAQPRCGFDDSHQKLLQSNAGYSKAVESLNSFVQDYVKKPHDLKPLGAGTAIYTIPVVVHIVHTGGAVGSIYNPTDAQIAATIDAVNQIYDGTYPGLSGGVGDMQIQFALAKRDPNCNPTTGIEHVDASQYAAYVANGVNRNNSSGISDQTLKDLSRWDANQYYNIWVVNKIDGMDGTTGEFVAGYAYFPGAPPSLDGTVMLASQMFAGEKTLPHELGHALALYHPFEGSNSSNNYGCPSNSDCSTQGDRVCDTDPVTYNYNATTKETNFTCRTGVNSCVSGGATSYSPNTENNFMAYTNCFKLFTAGQKSRALASMAGAGRASLATSLGATPTNSGTSPCTPKINFALAEVTPAEATTATSGCMGYTDYTYKMVIGNSPSAAATVTLTTSGPARAGIDYMLTTNGNFAAPSATLNFPAGSLADQSFTIRVFNDGAVEGTELLDINFTVNNNGGNAQKGTGVPTMRVKILDSDPVPTPIIKTSAEIGAGQIYGLGNETAGQPFDAKLSGKKTLMLYKASELTAMGLTAGNITRFAVKLDKKSTRPYGNLQVRMGQTNLAYLVENGSANGVTTNVVKSISSYTTVNDWNSFILDNPFAWDGISNIAVQICYSNGTADNTNKPDICYGYSDGGSEEQGKEQGNMFWADNTTCSSNFGNVGFYPGGLKPIAQFEVSKPGPVIETTQNASNTTNLGPMDEVWFYSAAGKIIARVKNLTNFDYGCTEVKIDRAGTSAKNFTGTVAQNQVADKTVQIIPTNNNASGQFEVTLYHTLAEVQGWKAATSLDWKNAEIIKTKNAVSSYNPGAVPAADTLLATATVHGNYGSDSSTTGSFSGNLAAGFAIGKARETLAEVSVTLSGSMVNGNANLGFTTNFETNTKEFVVETSTNGTSFSPLTTINSKGPSSQPQTYNYTHTNPPAGNNNYRIKLVDLNGGSVYSNTLVLTQSSPEPEKPYFDQNAATGSHLNLYLGSDANQAGTVSWEIFSSDLKLVDRKANQPTSSPKQISIAHLLPGVYFLRLHTASGDKTLRFVKP